MRWRQKVLLRVRSLFWRRAVDQELDEELRFHLERDIAAKTSEGAPPEEARYAAMREFGGVEQFKEECRDTRQVSWLTDIIQDVGYGLRMLRKSPGFSAVAILTLALGIAANTAIFSAVNGILLQRMPYPHPEELVTIGAYKVFPGTGVSARFSLSPPDLLQIQNQTPAIAQIATFRTDDFTLTGESAPEIVQTAQVSSDFFPVLGLPPLLGRTVLPGDTQPGQDKVAILSYALWKDMADGDTKVLGRSITLNEQRYVVIGVMPSEFEYPLSNATDRKRIWIPMPDLPDGAKNTRAGLETIARMRKGNTVAALNAQLKTVEARLSPTWPPIMSGGTLEAGIEKPNVGDMRTALLILMGAVTFVLLIACVNVSALLLTRSFTRQREIAVREALGASRMRILRQFLTESMLLAIAGGCAGILLSFWGVGVVQAVAPKGTAGIDHLQINAKVLLFTLGVSLLAGIAFGIAPALHAAAKQSGSVLTESLTGSISRYQSGSRKLRGALVVFEVALAAILVIGAGLMARSLQKLSAVDLGFRTDHLLTMSASFSPSLCDGSTDEGLTRCLQTTNEVVRRLQSLPGIEMAASLSNMPLQEGSVALNLQVEGRKEESGLATGDVVSERIVSAQYFSAMGVRFLNGRNFADSDTKSAPQVAVVNQAFAKRFFGGNAIGRRFNNGNSKKGDAPWIEVVGVVSDSRDFQLDNTPAAEYYLASAQSKYFQGAAHFLVRTPANPLAMIDAVKQQIWSVDKNAPITDVKTMDAIVAESVAEPKFRTLLLGSFGALGLILAMVGIYGVISYSVTQRTDEIGLRLALGAQPRDVLGLVLREGMMLAGLGIAVGAAGALALTRLLTSLLYEVKPRDPVTFIAVAIALAVVAAAACYIPARRAMRVDPMVALRYE
jgi:putative ABC transport system permease protein